MPFQGTERSLNLQNDNRVTSLRRERVIDCFLIFIICIIPRIYMALKAYPVIYASDEVSAFSIAASVAGYDWSDVVSNAGYYGIGFLWIFAPLFELNISPIWIYRIMLIVLGIVNALTGPLYYLIMTNYLNVNSRVWRIFIASICGSTIFLYVVDPCVRNEEITALLVCLTVYFLCKIVNQRKLRDEIFLFFVLMYSLTCHTRMIAVVLTVLAIGVLYYLFYKKKLFHLPFYAFCIVGVFIVNRLLRLYRAGIWTGTAVRNSSVSSGFMNSLKTMASVGNPLTVIQTWIKIVVGQLYTATTLTGGIFLIATVICLIFLFRWLAKKEWKSMEQKITESNIIIITFSIVLIFMTIASMGITWFPNVYNDMQTYGTETFASSYRAFIYTRYFGIYVPPLIMIAFSIAEKNYSFIKESSVISVFLYAVLFIVWISEIIKYLLTTQRNYFYFLAGFGNNTQASTGWFKVCFLGIIFMLIWFCISKKREYIIMIFSCLVLLECEQVYTFDHTVENNERKVYQEGDAGFALLNKSNIEFCDDIYVYDTSGSTDHQIFYIYQFLNYKYLIIPDLPQSSQEDFILFTNGRVKELENSGVLWWQLDNNEFVYTSITEYQEAISQYLENNV